MAEKDKLQRTQPPPNDFEAAKADAKPRRREPIAEADESDALPEHAKPLPHAAGPQPLPGRDDVEEPTDGE